MTELSNGQHARSRQAPSAIIQAPTANCSKFVAIAWAWGRRTIFSWCRSHDLVSIRLPASTTSTPLQFETFNEFGHPLFCELLSCRQLAFVALAPSNKFGRSAPSLPVCFGRHFYNFWLLAIELNFFKMTITPAIEGGESAKSGADDSLRKFF